MSETPQNPPPGYYPDGSGVKRWWDGNAWTEHVEPAAQAAAPQPTVQQPAAQQAAYQPAAQSFAQQPVQSPQEDRPWFKKKRWIISGALVALVIIGSALSGGSGSDDTNDTASENSSATSDTPDVADETTPAPAPATKATPKATPKPKPKPSAVKVSASQILKDYEDNELAADKKYKGKNIQVTGTVEKIDKEIFGNDYVLNISDGTDFVIITVNCNDMSEKELSTLDVGSEVTAIGEFDDGGDLGVELKKCKLA